LTHNTYRCSAFAAADSNTVDGAAAGSSITFEGLSSTEQFTYATTHGDAGLAKLMADRGTGNAQLGTDLAQGTSRLHAQRPRRHGNGSDLEPLLDLLRT
jgi:hypothetical protein